MRRIRVRSNETQAPHQTTSARGRGRMIIRIQWLLCMAGLLLLPCPSWAQPSDELGAAATDVAVQLARYFPPLEGEVVDVQGDNLYLSLGARDQVLEGMPLRVYREGEALTSPSTGAVLGRIEKDLGIVNVLDVGETYSLAVLVEPIGGDPVQEGDKVRITSGQLSLGLLPAVHQAGGTSPLTFLSDALQSGLSATGRFYMVPWARMAMWLLERNLPPGDMVTAEVMSEAAIANDAAYVVQPVLRRTSGGTLVELRLFAAGQPKAPVTTAVAMLSEGASLPQQVVPQLALEPPGAISRPAMPSEMSAPAAASMLDDGPMMLEKLLGVGPIDLEKRYVPLAHFPNELRGFDAADVNGDGLTELVLLSDAEVLLYHLEENQLSSIATYFDRRPGTLLSAQLVRLGPEQTPGIVVNRFSATRGGMDSFLLALRDRRLVRLQKALPDILLAVDTDGDGVNESLWGQRFDSKDFFRPGQVRTYELRNGRWKRQRKVVLPASFRATGAALAQLEADGNRQLVFVDGSHSLQVYDGKSKRWTSPADVGGSYVFATLGIIRAAGIFEQQQFDFEVIPAVVDLDGDGIDEVLVAQNQGSLGIVPNLNLYGGGHVVLMRRTPNGYRLSPVSPGFDGVVSGVAVLKGRTPGILVAVSRREGVLKQKRQTILYLNRL